MLVYACAYTRVCVIRTFRDTITAYGSRWKISGHRKTCHRNRTLLFHFTPIKLIRNTVCIFALIPHERRNSGAGMSSLFTRCIPLNNGHSVATILFDKGQHSSSSRSGGTRLRKRPQSLMSLLPGPLFTSALIILGRPAASASASAAATAAAVAADSILQWNYSANLHSDGFSTYHTEIRPRDFAARVSYRVAHKLLGKFNGSISWSSAGAGDEKVAKYFLSALSLRRISRRKTAAISFRPSAFVTSIKNNRLHKNAWEDHIVLETCEQYARRTKIEILDCDSWEL